MIITITLRHFNNRIKMNTLIFAATLHYMVAFSEDKFEQEPDLDLKLKYVFEIVRHGARAPLNYDPVFTKEALEMLTP